MLHICRVQAGPFPIQRYNAKAASEEQIRAGDYIVAVNGVSGCSSKLLLELGTNRDPLISILRPEVIDCIIFRDGRPLGVNLSFAGDGTGSALIVKDILEGAIRASIANIRQGDRIVAVDGESG